MRLNDIKLVREIRKHPCIWDESFDKNPNNRNVKLFMWAKIGYLMGDRVEQCQKRWKSFYDRFERNYIEQTDFENTRGKHKPSRLYEELSFLKPVLYNRKLESSKVQEIRNEEEQEANQIESDNEDNEFDEFESLDEMDVEYLDDSNEDAYSSLHYEVHETESTTSPYSSQSNKSAENKIDTNLTAIAERFQSIPEIEALSFKTEILEFAKKRSKYYISRKSRKQYDKKITKNHNASKSHKKVLMS